MEKRKAGRPRKVAPSADVVRKRLQEGLDDVVQGFLDAARKGGCSHFKLICELLQEGDQKKRRDPARVLLEQWRREQRQKQKARMSEMLSHGADVGPDESDPGGRDEDAFGNRLESVEG